MLARVRARFSDARLMADADSAVRAEPMSGPLVRFLPMFPPLAAACHGAGGVPAGVEPSSRSAGLGSAGAAAVGRRVSDHRGSCGSPGGAVVLPGLRGPLQASLPGRTDRAPTYRGRAVARTADGADESLCAASLRSNATSAQWRSPAGGTTPTRGRSGGTAATCSAKRRARCGSGPAGSRCWPGSWGSTWGCEAVRGERRRVRMVGVVKRGVRALGAPGGGRTGQKSAETGQNCPVAGGRQAAS